MRALLSVLLSLFLTECALAKESLVIISPHRKSIQDEFIPRFEEYYQRKFGSKISAEWLDQGGASDDLKFILARFEKNSNSALIDVFWGGGEHPHYELDSKRLLESFPLPPDLKKEVPPVVAGVRQYNESETWHAAALSSFGIFFNKFLLKMQKLSEPKVWSDLADAKFFNNLSNADPRRSSSNVTMNFVILQAFGWDKGWDILTRIAANTRSFRHSSSDPIKDVVSGDAAAGIVIGYFANAKVGDLGTQKIGFSLPTEQTIINPDPVSILKGAPNKLQAQRFVEFLLSSEAQKLFLLPKGAQGGPSHSSLARISVNKKAYEETAGRQISSLLNPFDLTIKPMSLQADKVTLIQFILTDLIGTLLIDHHQDLKDAWEAIIKRGLKPEDLKELARMPIGEQQLDSLALKWSDNVFRNTTINSWHEFASRKYAGLKTPR